MIIDINGTYAFAAYPVILSRAKNLVFQHISQEILHFVQDDRKRVSPNQSAHRSIQTNLLYPFTYQQYPHLKIPNTTNSLDGYFSKLTQLLNTHRGLTIDRRYRLIQEILANPSQQKFN